MASDYRSFECGENNGGGLLDHVQALGEKRGISFDIRATSRLNRLYVELLKDNLEWGHSRAPP